MDNPHTAKHFPEHQDLLGQLIRMHLYTPICLCFPIPDASSKSQIIVDTLRQGLERLRVSFPWLAGQVIREGVVEGNTGRSKIIPLANTNKTIPLIVKDLSHDTAVPSMEALRNAKFPFSMLDGEVLAPLSGLPTSYEGDPAPVFFIQANFINGGLLLNFAGEHSTMDGQGLGEIIRMFDKACHNNTLTDEELFQGNRARDGIIPLFDQTSYKPGPELDHLLVKPRASTSTTSDNMPPPKCTWAYFHFSSANLAKLKAKASSSSSPFSENTTAAPYITTNDALSAFIWQSTSRIRSPRLPPHSTTTFARAVDVRSSLSIPPCYPGYMSNHTYTTLPLSSFLVSSSGSTSLNLLSSFLRLALNPSDLRFTIQSLATHISLTVDDKSGISPGANLDFSTDIFFSSWARLGCYKFSFNLGLGLPESVRRPRYATVESLMYLMPMDRIRGIDAAICLRDEDLERLRSDQEFRKYADWIG